MMADVVNQPTTVDQDQFMLTTIDNPYSPKTDYELWQRWDQENGYHTESYIARLLHMEADYDGIDDEFMVNMLLSKVINEILEQDIMNVYVLV
jgi:hypothetical protein